MEKPLARRGRHRLAGQAHQPGLARLRLLAVPRRDLSRARAAARCGREPIIAAPAARCLDVCPTQAFPAPYRLDARRCISYLTIEHKGQIAARAAAADRQPHLWLRRLPRRLPLEQIRAAPRARPVSRRAPSSRRRSSPSSPALDDAGFRALFAGSPIKRIGRDRFVRNVLIAIGNSGDARLAAGGATALLADPSPLVRAMAVWALLRLGGAGGIRGGARRPSAGGDRCRRSATNGSNAASTTGLPRSAIPPKSDTATARRRMHG